MLISGEKRITQLILNSLQTINKNLIRMGFLFFLLLSIPNDHQRIGYDPHLQQLLHFMHPVKPPFDPILSL